MKQHIFYFVLRFGIPNLNESSHWIGVSNQRQIIFLYINNETFLTLSVKYVLYKIENKIAMCR